MSVDHRLLREILMSFVLTICCTRLIICVVAIEHIAVRRLIVLVVLTRLIVPPCVGVAFVPSMVDVGVPVIIILFCV